MKVNLLIIIFGLILFRSCFAAELNQNEKQAKLFAQKASDKLFIAMDQIDNLNNKDPTHGESLEAFHNLSQVSQEIFNGTEEFDFKNFKDEDLRYTFQTIRDFIGELVLNEDQLLEIFGSIFELEDLPKIKQISDYNDENIDLNYEPQVKRIIKSSNDSAELLYYWTEWRKVTGEWAWNIDLLVKGLIRASRIQNMSIADFWMYKNNITEMENLMADIRPFYEELHAFIRDRLKQKYGNDIIGSDGLIPDHLFEQVLEQAWTNDSILEDIYPHENLPPVESVMKWRFEAINLYERPENFYAKLGFEKYPYSIWNDRIKMISPKVKNSEEDDDDDDEEECKANVFYSTPNVRLNYCQNMTFMDFLEAYVQMGSLYYAKEMKGLPAYFFDTYGLEEAIGKAVILSTSTHRNLKAIGMIIDFNLTAEVEMNRLLRKAIQKVLQIPIDFVHTKYMLDLLGDKMINDTSRHYWDLMAKYAGIAIPKGFKSEHPSMAYKFFKQLNENEMARHFNMEILSYQIYKKMCQLSGKYSKDEFHLCDVHGSKDAGDALKKMMKLGTSKPFNEVLAGMFPENPKIEAQSLLEYYNPVKNLVTQMNKDAKVKTGWKDSEVV